MSSQHFANVCKYLRNIHLVLALPYPDGVAPECRETLIEDDND